MVVFSKNAGIINNAFMLQLIFATNNKNKAAEINATLENAFRIITLKEAGIDIDIPEPFNTIEENATEKANVIYKLTGKPCFGEDTGLEIEILQGAPGVKSARYAGEEKSDDKNIEKVLKEMEGKKNRKARFKTVIALNLEGTAYSFEGICEGTIIATKRGINGFGYDPIFVPLNSDKTFAEMEMWEKNKYSHRKKAVDKLIRFLISMKKEKEIK